MILTTNLYCTCRREILSTNLGAVGDNWPLSIKAYLCVLTTMVVIVYSLVAVNCRILLTVDHTISMTLRSCMRFSVSVLTALVARFLRIQAGYLLPADTIWMFVSIGAYCALNGELTVASYTSTMKIATYESCICLHSSLQYALRVVVFTPLSDTWGGKCQVVGFEARRVVPDANILRLLKLFLIGSNSVSEFTDLKIV